jgi:2-methylcitrate dehydratase PrpD
MDPIRKLATHFAAARYEDLSSEAREAAKMTVLDTAGAALAGSSSEPGRGIARIAQRYGGATGSTLLAHGARVATPMAALANGVMARCGELDGTHETGGGHVGVCMVPAALALVEIAPAPVSGRELALGIALGVDMLCRLRMGAGKSKAIGWMAETMAPMSVAAMGSRLFGARRGADARRDRPRLRVVQRQRPADGRGSVELVDAGRLRGGGGHPRRRYGA